MKRLNECYTSRTWAHLLLHYLKEAGDKGMTKDQIMALFPSKSSNAIGAVLYRYGIKRKAFKDKKTGKCRKRYFLTEKGNWKKQVKNLLKTTEYGLSLTDLLLETGIPKKKLEEYLDALKNSIILKSVETVKLSGGRCYPITRYYLGDRDIQLKKDEELFSTRKGKIKNKIDQRKQVLETVKEALRSKDRFTYKEILNTLLERKVRVTEYNIRRISKEEGCKTCYVSNFTRKTLHPYAVFYRAKEVPLLSGEIPYDLIDLYLKEQIINTLKDGKRMSKGLITCLVEQRIKKDIVGEASDKNTFSDSPHQLFQKAFHSLIDCGKVQRSKGRDNLVYYTLK